MDCKVCGKKAYKNNFCERHYMRAVNEIDKWIFEARTRPKGHKSTHTFESWGIDGTYTESPYRRKK